MASASPVSIKSPASTAASGLPVVRLEMRHGSAKPIAHDVSDVSFLVGSVPGCDLRLPGVNLPPVLCLIQRQPDGVTLRKLAPALPLLINGQPAAYATLANGDRITLGAVDLLVELAGVSSATVWEGEAPAEPGTQARRETRPPKLVQHQPAPQLDDRLRQLEERENSLKELEEELETDRAIWYRRREQVEQECKQQTEAAVALSRKLQQQERELAAARAELEERETAFLATRAQVESQHSKMSGRSEELAQKQQELIAVKREMADLRRQLYDRYRERRDRLAGVQESVRKTARKVQERKRQLDAEVAQFLATQTDDKDRRERLEALAEEVTRERAALDERQRLLESRQEQLQNELSNRLAECQERERKFTADRTAFEKGQSEFQTDLVRLHRLQEVLENRQKQLQGTALEIDKRYEQLQRDSRDLEEQATQLDEWHTKVMGEAEALTQHKAEADAVQSQLALRAAATEGQQAMLATLRTRLERMREEAHRQETQLAQQKTRQDEVEADLQKRVQEAEQTRAEIDAGKQLHDEERRRFEERRAVLDGAVAQIRQLQENLSQAEERLSQKEKQLEATAAELAEQAALVRARGEHIDEQQQRVSADRQALKEREAALAKSEQALAALQEQLRRRSEELAARQKTQTEQQKSQEEATAALEARQAEMERRHQEAIEQFAALRRQIEDSTADLERNREELSEREQAHQRHVDHLKESGRKLGGDRKALTETQAQWEQDQREVAAELDRRRTELDMARAEAAALHTQLPELQLRATEAADKLTQARTQLREHLAEVHAYARHSRDDLEKLRGQVQADAETVHQQQLALHREREEHRLAVAAFRQQLIDWQGQVAELKQSLAHGETRLERRKAEVEEQARQIDFTSQRLAEQAQTLEEQQRVVAERRGEMERHLSDMREWYRRKLRELAGVDESAVTSSPPHLLTSSEGERDILTLTGEEPGDRQLGDLLRSLELVDPETLTALFVDARRQRRSLRQLLLAGGYLTLYQIALIEAGNLDGLVLGPVRVIDRLRATPREVVYRVFDPRTNEEAVLRHLTEAEMHDAVHPDEFRQRFGQAVSLRQPNVVATLEVLEIAGRPAVLQECVTGVVATDWPPLTAAPAVWHRLLSQAALGLHAAHQAGLVHGHLTANLLLLTSDATLKIAGFGEPDWLAVSPANSQTERDAAGDLAALGRIAAALAHVETPKRGKNKLPQPLQAILRQLTAEDGEARYPTTAALLADLDNAASSAANPAAWERFIRQVGALCGETAAARKSA